MHNPPVKLSADQAMPIASYFGAEAFAREQAAVFATAPRYAGHQLMVPTRGDYYVLAHRDNAQMLLHAEDDHYTLVSNVCRHSQSVMLEGRGNARVISCPVHRWAYDLHGRQIAAPHFKTNPCRNLAVSPLQVWQGMLFEAGRDVAAELRDLPLQDCINFDKYTFNRAETVTYDVNWKIFIEVYLENYHVGPMHPGLGNFVNPPDLTWYFSEHYSLHSVGIRSSLSKPGTSVYRDWHEAVLRRFGAARPPFGAIWMLYYPNIMLEWYPGALVISTVQPLAPEKCLNVVEFFYDQDIVVNDPAYIAAHQRAYQETALEDEAIYHRLARGRRICYLRGEQDYGPKHSPLEDGVVAFHRYLNQKIGE